MKFKSYLNLLDKDIENNIKLYCYTYKGALISFYYSNNSKLKFLTLIYKDAETSFIYPYYIDNVDNFNFYINNLKDYTNNLYTKVDGKYKIDFYFTFLEQIENENYMFVSKEDYQGSVYSIKNNKKTYKHIFNKSDEVFLHYIRKRRVNPDGKRQRISDDKFKEYSKIFGYDWLMKICKAGYTPVLTSDPLLQLDYLPEIDKLKRD